MVIDFQELTSDIEDARTQLEAASERTQLLHEELEASKARGMNLSNRVAEDKESHEVYSRQLTEQLEDIEGRAIRLERTLEETVINSNKAVLEAERLQGELDSSSKKVSKDHAISLQQVFCL